MSSTRTADANAPLSQERYMSSPEYAGLRAIIGTAVAQRCALLQSPAKRQLLWFIQAMSIADGGLKRMAKEFLTMFRERIIVPPRSELLGIDVDELLASWVGEERSREEKPVTDKDCEDVALGNTPLGEPRATQSFEEFFIDLCINPRILIEVKETGPETTELEAEKAMEEFPGLARHSFRPARLVYFRDIIGALFEYKRRHEARVKEDFCLTAIGRQVWKQLDDALKTGTMVVIDGLEGRGKTEAVRAWCNCHLGVARFITLDGTTTKTGHFREFARALGLSHGPSWKAAQMEARVKDVLRSSGLMVVVDEAHFFFNQGPRMWTRPEMLDWIDTALCNPPLPVALVTTPQFMVCIERAARHVGWNYRQFRRRSRYCRLPQKNSHEDIEAVTRHLLPGADKRTVTLVLGYVAISKRDLSAVGDVAREARLLAEQEGARKVTFEHVNRAIQEVLVPGDTPWAEMEQRLRNDASSRRRQGMPTLPAPDAHERAPVQSESEPLAPVRGATRPGRGVTPGPDRGRLLEPETALVSETG